MARRTRAGWVRLILLCAVFCGVGISAAATYQARAARTDWNRALEVSVVLVSDEPLSPQTVDSWHRGMKQLEAWTQNEFSRYAPTTLAQPVKWKLEGPVHAKDLPSLSPVDDGVWAQVEYSLYLSRTLNGYAQQLEPHEAAADARIFVLLEHTDGSIRRVEGIAARRGVVGAVRAPAQDEDLTLSLTAVVHEFLHCVGASDKYDAEGHALLPVGLPSPNQQPLFPQRHGEIMVGEIAEGPNYGRLPSKLSEMRVGPSTAREIGWLRP